MAEPKPSQIGRYQILDELGRGGFGRVYRAYDPTVGRPVAIKILTQVSDETRIRFRNEAMVVGNLWHNNIVTVYEYGTHDELPFLAMEYLEGEDLHHIISSRKPLSLLEKCNIMSQVAEGLYCAHRRGVVHRDMKPANIMVLRDGTVKIMDFGIARLTRTADATRLTQQGFLIGTLRYMAPEQLSGTDVDSQCDIFAYGVIYYELMAGRHPFEAPDVQSLIYKLTVEEPRPIRELAADVPGALEQVIFRCVHKNRQLRYQSLKDVQFDTEPVRLELRRDSATALLSQAQELYKEKQLEPALKAVQEALSLEPSDRTARMLWENLQQQLQQRSRQPQVESSLSTAEQHLVHRRFGEAVQALEAALLLDSNSSRIQARLDAARALLEHAQRASQLLAEARLELEHQNLTAAYRIVSEALRHDPKNPDAAQVLNAIEEFANRRQAEQRVNNAIRKAQGLMLIPAYDEAIAVLMALEPDLASPRVREFLDRLRSEKGAHERKQKLHREMAAATELLRDQHLNEATQRLEDLQAEFPENQDVTRLLAFARQEQAARARSHAVEQARAEACARAESNDFEGALATLDQALREYPGDSGLIRLVGSTVAAKGVWERQQAIQSTLTRCEALRSERRFAEAVQTVEAALQEHTTDTRLLALLAQLQAEGTQQRREEAIREVGRPAEQFLAQRQPEAALAAVQQALARYPGDPALETLREGAQAALKAKERAAAAERAASIQKLEREAREIADTGDFEGALALLDRGLRDWPEAVSLRGMREKALTGQERFRKRQRALDDLQEVIRLTTQAQAAKETVELLELAKSIAAQHPDDKELQSLAAAAIGILSDMTRAGEELARGNFQAALSICAARLSQFPDHAAFHQLLEEAARGQRRSFVETVQHRAAAEPDLERRMRMLEQALAEYPDEVALTDELRFARNNLRLADSVVHAARSCEQAGQWDEALVKWNSLGTIYKDYPGLQAEILRVRRAKEKAVSDAVEDRIKVIDRTLQAGDLTTAGELLRQAQAEYPESGTLRDLARRVQQIGEKRKRARELVSQAQAASEHGDDDSCQSCLRQAFQMDESDTALRSFILGRLMDYAQSMLHADWRRAEVLIEQATHLQPGYAIPLELRCAIAERKNSAAPRGQHASETGGRATATVVPQPGTGPRMEPGPPQNGAATPAHPSTPLEGAGPSGSKSVDFTAGGKPSRLPAALAANRTRLVVGASALAAGLALIPAIQHLLRTPGDTEVSITTNVAGTSVSVGEKRCTTPNCAMTLPPGSYALRATADGYEAVTRQVAIAPGQSRLRLDLPMQRLAQVLQVNTNFESGQVYVDGHREGDLKDGQYSASGVKPGLHTIRISGRGTEFQAKWKSLPGAPPEVIQLAAGKDLESTIVANAGTKGSVICNCDARQAKVDGASGDRDSSRAGDPIPLKGLLPGARQIELGQRSLVVDIRANPTLTVFLSLNRNTGTLIVETGEDHVKVFLNNQLYRRTTEHGMLRISAAVGEYSVRVEKDGFLSPAPRTLALKKGEEKAVAFALTPARAYLEIAGGVAGAQVKIDGQRIGELDQRGNLRYEVTPGPHAIELARNDYAPMRVSEEFHPGKTIQLSRGQVAMRKAAGSATPDLKQVEGQEWTRIANSTNAEEFDEFFRRHPGGAHADQARARAAELRHQAQANAARQAEQTAWERVDQNSREQLKDYLSRFPAGADSTLAQTRIAALDREVAEALVGQRQREQREQEKARSAAEEQAILKVLRSFDTAYNRKDLASLQRLWSGVPVAAYRQQFREAKDLRFQLQVAGQPILNGNTATAICTRTLTYRGQSGGSQTHSERVKVTLFRDASGWSIRSIELN